MNQDNKRGPDQVRIPLQYTFAAQHRTILATGAWGGGTPHGMVRMLLYTETGPLPQESRLVVDVATGKAISEDHDLSNVPINREVQTTVLLMPDTAIEIGRWLIRHGEDQLKALASTSDQATRQQGQ